MSEISLRDRLAGGVWGHLVGDAMGVPYEFRSRRNVGDVTWGETGTWHQPPGTWSDDGALMLALLDSLLSAGFDVEDQGRRAVRWMRDGAYTPSGVFDIGNATRSALLRIAGGTPAAEAGGTGEHANGNGSLMRILPVALLGRDLDDRALVEQAAAASATTHAHPRSKVTCAVYVLLARSLLGGAPDRQAALDEALDAVESNIPPGWQGDFAKLREYPDRRGDGYVLDCFWSAWDAFHGASTYPETVARAISYGNDTDTTACVAGGLAGIYWGVDAIPDEWRTGMRGRLIVEPMLDALLALRQPA